MWGSEAVALLMQPVIQLWGGGINDGDMGELLSACVHGNMRFVSLTTGTNTSNIQDGVLSSAKAKGSDSFNVNVERHTHAKPSLLVKTKQNVGGTIWNPDEAAFSK